MKIMYFSGMVILGFLLTGCASLGNKPFVASDSDYDNYFSNQEMTEHKTKVTHEVHGIMTRADDPYKSDYDSCTESVFSGKTISFGTHNVSDPEVLRRMWGDYSLKLVMFFLKSRGGSVVTQKVDIFDDESVKKKMTTIGQLMDDRRTCTQGKGWTEVKKARK